MSQSASESGMIDSCSCLLENISRTVDGEVFIKGGRCGKPESFFFHSAVWDHSIPQAPPLSPAPQCSDWIVAGWRGCGHESITLSTYNSSEALSNRKHLGGNRFPLLSDTIAVATGETFAAWSFNAVRIWSEKISIRVHVFQRKWNWSWMWCWKSFHT